VVQFEKTTRIRARLSGVPQPVETPTRFSGCGSSQRLKPFRFSLHGGIAEAEAKP